MTCVADSPTEQQVKDILLSLPVPPCYKVLLIDVPTASGRVYPRAVVEKALAMAQSRIKGGGMDVGLYHGTNYEVMEHVGVVTHAMLEDGALMVEISFCKDVAMKHAELTTVGTGAIGSEGVRDYVWESVAIRVAAKGRWSPPVQGEDCDGSEVYIFTERL